MVNCDRWENGSFFHWISDKNTEIACSPWDENGAHFGSARDAFRCLLEYGRASRGWKRLWVPSYFCQEVIAVLVATGIDVRLYQDGPEDDMPQFDAIGMYPGDVLLRVNFFGLRGLLQSDAINRDYVEIIDDHTHDPWSDCAWNSDADWCVVSVRKVLPVPDGGILWSPCNHQLPVMPISTEEHQTACMEKLTAMVLKKLYLDGHPLDKQTFRILDISGETKMSSEKISAMPEWVNSLLDCFPIKAWRNQRQINHTALSAELADISWLNVLQPADTARTCPFSVIVAFDSPERRDYVRNELISNGVYPAILWPLEKPVIEGIDEKYRRFSRSMISIHCDMRYDPLDMARIACLIRDLD